MLLTLAGAVIAADLREDHPTTYVVKKGDTLWDIAGRFLKKPWLWPEIWQANPQVQNPHLIFPGQVLSLQLHHRRSEHWTVVQGTAKVRIGEREFLLQRNESAYIPVETLHRLENPTDQDIALIEVQCGDYFGEDDIVRLEDVYGRDTRAAGA